MAPYRGCSSSQRTVKIVDDGAGGPTLEQTALTKRLFDFSSQEQVKLTPNSAGLLFVPPRHKASSSDLTPRTRNTPAIR